MAPADSRTSPSAPLGYADGFSRAIETGPLLALRASDGEILWQRDLGSPLQRPAGSRRRSALSSAQRRTDSGAVAPDRRRNLDAQAELNRPSGILAGRRSGLRRRSRQSAPLARGETTPSTDWKWRTGADVSERRCSMTSACTSSRSTTCCAVTAATADRCCGSECCRCGPSPARS